MTEQTNADLIAEANRALAENQWTSGWGVESLAHRLVDALEAVVQERDNWKLSAEEAERAEKRWRARADELAAVVEKVRAYLEEGKGAYTPDLLDILATAPTTDGSAADQRAAEYAAVIEQAEDYVTRHYLDTRFGAEVLPILAADSADALREVKAEAWDQGWHTGYRDHSEDPLANMSDNPYRAREEQS